ncbi:MAG TPA: type II toxin-antitoxin system VapC family toxin [Pyrinomonadaceae bacterium]|jgi:PIN domain nuclease of toxin-antitoxin system|nr:type II toxin-antitoxin system VapC family toxin [Pyrinomonadaceae bacterium]
MRLLLDTHILIWFLEGNPKLSNERQQIITVAQNDVFVSIASLWEMAVKISLGKLTLCQPLADVVKQLAADNIETLPILPPHVLQVSTMPFHHRDPFDRIIIAQSDIENLPIMTDDQEFAAYGVKLF